MYMIEGDSNLQAGETMNDLVMKSSRSQIFQQTIKTDILRQTDLVSVSPWAEHVDLKSQS